MSLRNDAAVQAARDIELKEIEDGYTLVGGPEESVTEQHDTDRIPEVDVTQEMLSGSAEDPEAWLMYGGGYEQHRNTTADVITPDNVGSLQLEYELSVGTGSSMEGTPIVIPGDPPIMYQTNGPNHMKAIDAREGEVLWSYTYAPPIDVLLCCDDNNRGAAVLGDTVFMTTLDAGVVALNRYTGEEEWYTQTADHEVGYSATWAPVVYDDKILTGSAGGEYGVLGFIASLDTESGEILWKSDTLPEDEWIGASRDHGCGTSWMTPTIDEERGVLFSPVGNPGPDFDGTVRPGPNFPTCGTVRMNLEDGEMEWGFQESPHDVWDYDSTAPRVLIRDVDIDGEDGGTDVVLSSGKTGWVYTIDADDGRLYERSEECSQHINMWKMIPHISEEERVSFVPGAPGGNDWQPPSYSPETGLVYVVHQNFPQDLFWRFEEYEPGDPYWGGGLDDPAAEIPDEWNGFITHFVAVDPTTGEVVWQDQIESDHYMWGGSMTTSTGLVFNGTQNGSFVAYDGDEGERLWEHEFPVPISASPMSWYDPGEGKQYVAVQVGGSGWLRQGPRGDTLAVFSMGE